VPVEANCRVVPFFTVALAGEIDIDTSTGGATVSVAEPVTFPSDAVIPAVL
jgi:hypothetical protein